MINTTVDILGSSTLTTYVWDNSPEMDPGRKRPSVIVCPGGGYEFLSDREAEPIALKLVGMGYNAFVLRYSLTQKFPKSLQEAAEAVRTVRANSDRWHVQTDRVFIMGFSAGGHLAASLGTLWDREFVWGALDAVPEDCRPDGIILSYPVISSGIYAHRGSFVHLLQEDYEEKLALVSLENQVTRNTSPTFIWHTVDDGAVPIENTLLFISALQENGVPFEAHIFPRGTHGLALADRETSTPDGGCLSDHCAGWPSLLEKWIRSFGDWS